MSEKSPNEFEQAAAQQGHSGILAEYWYFLRHSKRWWLIPVIVVLLAFSLFMLLTSTSAAPFIYTLF